MCTLKVWIFLFFCALSGIAAQAQTIRYVKPAAAGSGDGSSWANASGDLQAMINTSVAGDEIWVAAGTYKPTTGTDRAISFSMKDGVAIYGGFPASGAPGMIARDWTAHETILSGDIGVVGDNSDNSYHVIKNLSLTQAAVLDGFTISDGNATGAWPYNLGGGMSNSSSSPTVLNCSFLNNRALDGGGMGNINTSSPIVSNCIFSGNHANGQGGGMSTHLSSSPAITNSIFTGNWATYGGGISMYGNSAPSVVNCSFSGNYGIVGGGVYAWAPGYLANCIIWGNNTDIYDESKVLTVTHSILQQSYVIYHGASNLKLDPLFVDQPPIGLGTGGDLRLQACSPAVDGGTNVGAPDTDYDGQMRPFNSYGAPAALTDIGAFEYQQTQTSITPFITISGPTSGGCQEATFTASPVNGGLLPQFNWKVNGVAVGVYTATFSVTGLQIGEVVSCDMSSSAPCAFPTSVSSNGITITQELPPLGNPAEFGDNVWNVYAWNAGGASPAADSWNTDYQGYYTVGGLNFNTQSQWFRLGSPSAAPGYLGCKVNNDNHSWSAKRRGFTEGCYRLSVDSHDDAFQLWINGSLIREESGCCTAYPNAWEGFLDANSTVEFRVTEGDGASLGALSFQQITAQISQTGDLCTAGSATLTLTDDPAGDYQWSTGETTSSITVTEPGVYSVTVTGSSGCSVSASTYVVGPVGDPAVFGDNVWNIYAWNAGGGTNTGNSWNTDYAGYYTVSSLQFYSFQDWPWWASPSYASNYQGCPVNLENHSWSAKRKGFPCGKYRIDIWDHDDYAQLWIDGVMVWDAPCCGSKTDAWTGVLDADSEVEFRVTEGGGNSSGGLSFNALPQTLPLTGLNGLCSASPATLAVQGNPSGSYLWSTGEETPSILITAPGDYSVTVTLDNGCTVTASGTAPAPAGDPAEFGDNIWNVYAWNAGGESPTSDSWNTDYAGYYTVNSLNFNSEWQWPYWTSPSSAQGYQGCPVDSENHSFSARRRGFSCDIYSINIENHDDAAQLWINGEMVWEHIGCCDSHSDIWIGALGPNDEVEFRVTEGDGSSRGAISFKTGIVLTGTANICYGASDGMLSAPEFSGATYSWSNGEQTAAISDLAAGEYCVTVSTSGGCFSASQCVAINSYPQAPQLSIVPDGSTTACPGTEVELCSSVASLPGLIYTLTSTGGLQKFIADLSTHTLMEETSYFPIFSTSYSIARNPVTKTVFLVLLNNSEERALYTFDMRSQVLTELGPIFSADGSNSVESITFDRDGNLFAVFSNGLIDKIDYTSPSLTATNLPVSPALPSSSIKHLTYDFDHHRLIYVTGSRSSTVYGINLETGTSSYLIAAFRPSGMEYVGNNQLYMTASRRVYDLTNGSYQSMSLPSPFPSAIDILYVPGISFEWSGPEGVLGDTECIAVAPTSTADYTLVIQDANGCTTEAAITIANNLPPIAECLASLEVNLSAPTVLAEALDSGSSGCTALSFLINGQSSLVFDCDQLGPNVVTLTVIDDYGQADNCQVAVTVTDDVDPTVLCRPAAVYLDADGNVTLSAAQVDNGSFDDCGFQSLSVSPNSFTCGEVGAHTVTLTVIDLNGNSSTCTATVTVEDNTHPSITCPASMTVSLPNGACETVVTYPAPTATDNCSGGSISQTAGLGSGAFFQVGTTTESYLVTDAAGQTAGCSFTVTVKSPAPGDDDWQLAPNIRMWPPDYAYQTFSIADMVAGVVDGCGVPVSIDNIRIDQVTSDEAEDDPGPNDGSTLDDIVISDDCRSVQLRKERMSNGNGRVYVITLAREEAGGSVSYADFEVSAPRWPWGWYSVAIQDAPRYSIVCSSGAEPDPQPLARLQHDDRAQTALHLSAYPNPFRSELTIRFHLPNAGHTSLQVFNLQGQPVRRLNDGFLDAGEHQWRWNGESEDGRSLPSGVYFVQMNFEGKVVVRKVALH